MRPSHMSGFSMIDLLAVMGLMGVLVVCLAKVGAEAARQNRAQAAADHGAQVEDRVVKQLRRDMWNAASICSTDTGGLQIAVNAPENDRDCCTTTWECVGENHQTLRRTMELARERPTVKDKDGCIWMDMVVYQSTSEDFPLSVPASFEMATEKFVNPNGWDGPGPIPYAARLHLGHDDIYLPNPGVFTYGFAVDSDYICPSDFSIPKTAP